MTILVTGGAGYIGSHMVHRLAQAGERVVVLDNLSTGFAWAIPAGTPLTIAESGDVARVRALIAEHGIDTIVHFAASLVVPDSVRDPLRYYLNNTVNSRALLEAAVNSGIKRFIFSSTAAVYGNPERSPVDEDARPAPASPYGRSKLMTETMLADVGAVSDLAYVILRYFNVAGADPALRTGQSTLGATHLIKVALETALGLRPKIDVYGTDYATPDGTCIRDYIHVCDLVEAHMAALAYLRDGGASTTLNCGYGHGYSVLEVIDAVKRVSGRAFRVENAPRREGDPVAIVADATRIRRQLGWTPRYDNLDVIVAHALAWERHLIKRREAEGASQRVRRI
ncbi:MAG: UDP-glucose 4-epimerase GalE [Hyphomicrobiales bacterium]|nr:UDP-glucose 4-epimerase GalE [Hyphomicrobiales bacterium]